MYHLRSDVTVLKEDKIRIRYENKRASKCAEHSVELRADELEAIKHSMLRLWGNFARAKTKIKRASGGYNTI